MYPKSKQVNYACITDTFPTGDYQVTVDRRLIVQMAIVKQMVHVKWRKTTPYRNKTVKKNSVCTCRTELITDNNGK